MSFHGLGDVIMYIRVSVFVLSMYLYYLSLLWRGVQCVSQSVFGHRDVDSVLIDDDYVRLVFHHFIQARCCSLL